MSDNPYKSFDHHIEAQEAEIARLRAKVAELEADNAALRNNKTEEALRQMTRDPRYILIGSIK